jgi:hypothetical protein
MTAAEEASQIAAATGAERLAGEVDQLVRQIGVSPAAPGSCQQFL